MCVDLKSSKRRERRKFWPRSLDFRRSPRTHRSKKEPDERKRLEARVLQDDITVGLKEYPMEFGLGAEELSAPLLEPENFDHVGEHLKERAEEERWTLEHSRKDATRQGRHDAIQYLRALEDSEPHAA